MDLGDIKKTFPKLFSNPRFYGFECGDGWNQLIHAGCKSIQNHIDWTLKQIENTKEWNRRVEDPEEDWDRVIVPRELREVPKEVPQVSIIQIKEKFGELRFYYSGGDEYIKGIVDLMYSISRYTCEVCGAPGHLSLNRGWYKTLCADHANELNFKKVDEYG